MTFEMLVGACNIAAFVTYAGFADLELWLVLVKCARRHVRAGRATYQVDKDRQFKIRGLVAVMMATVQSQLLSFVLTGFLFFAHNE